MQGGAWRHQTTPKGNHSGSHNNDYISICCRILATAKEGRGVEVSNAFAANENPRMRHITIQIGLMGTAVSELAVSDIVRPPQARTAARDGMATPKDRPWEHLRGPGSLLGSVTLGAPILPVTP